MSESERRQRTISSTPRLTPDEVAARSFPTAFRGISETDVRAFLKRVADDLGALRSREQELSDTIDELEARLRTPRPLDEQELLDALGEETTRLLRSAREAASDIRTKAEERAARLVHDAHEEAQRVRQEADEVLGVRTQEAESVANGMLEEAEQRAGDVMRVADERAHEVRATADRYGEELRARVDREAALQVDGARERGAALLEEATNLRQQVIEDLARRRELLSGQLEELRTGRDELLDAYRVVKRTFLEATDALAQVEAKATAGRPAPATDPADLAPTLAAEADAARDAGLDAESTAGDPAPVSATADAAIPDSEIASSATPDEPGAEAGVSAGETTAPTDVSVDGSVDTPVDESVDEPSGDRAADDSTATDAKPESSGGNESAAAPDGDDRAAEPGAAVEGALDIRLDDRADDDGESTAPNLADVDDLFARLRAGAQPEGGAEDAAATEPAGASLSGAIVVKAVEPTATSATSAVPNADAEGADTPEWLARRDAALAPLRVALVRQVKLAIGNEQNEVLDKVRRHKGRPVASAALPEPDAQTAAWTAVLATAVSKAYGLGASSDDGAPLEVPDDLAAGLASAMVEPLRDRLVATIDSGHEPGETSSQVAERIGARYREWKNRSAESSADDALVAAYARGHYDRVSDGSVLTWHLPPGGCCVDCADNALEPTRKGEAFPTGQHYPPAHPGCRCAITSDHATGDASSEHSTDVAGGLGVESSTSS